MGGSSSDQYWSPRHSGPGGQEDEVDCFLLQPLEKLQMARNGPLQAPGAVLEVLKVQAGAGTAVAVVDDDGEIVGTILNQAAQLLRCMNQGVAYVAEVLNSTADVNSVKVRPSDVSSAAGTYGVDGEATEGSFSVEVENPDRATDVLAGPNTISRESICELRSLLRVAVQFGARVETSGAATVFLR